MYAYVIRPKGDQYDVCGNGTAIEDGSGLCMMYPESLTIDLINSSVNLLIDVDTEPAAQTKSPLDGSVNKDENMILLFIN